MGVVVVTGRHAPHRHRRYPWQPPLIPHHEIEAVPEQVLLALPVHARRLRQPRSHSQVCGPRR